MKIKFAPLLLLLIFPALASAQATQQWVSIYNGPANGHDVATAIALDGAGNVYVTGYSDGGAATKLDYVTIKYDLAGNQIWVMRYNGTGNGDDVPVAIAVDASGNVYVTGYSLSSVGGFDYATISYDTNGVFRWLQLYNGPASGDDFAAALALDGAGNVFVTGGSDGGGTGFDYATIAYDSAGNPLWGAAARYDGGNGDDLATAITTDGLGNVYVTGQSMGAGTGFDYATIAYDPLGNPLWAATPIFDGTGGDDVALGIAVDGAGNAYVTGYSMGTGTGFDIVTIAYDPTGAFLWQSTYDRGGDDFGYAIVFDPNGFVYVTGSSFGAGTDMDYATIQYDPATGTELWSMRYDGPSSSRDEPLHIAVDIPGNVYVTGYSFAQGSGYDYATVSYDSAGVLRWVRRYDGFGSDDVAEAVIVDGSGNVFVTGFSTGVNGRDFATLMYSQP